MPSLSAYSADLPYAYAPGVFPSIECLRHRPELVTRVLLHSSAEGREGAETLRRLAAEHHIRVETADRALSRISGKENCFAAAVFRKFSDGLAPEKPHVVLVNPADSGNVGTILRTSLGFGVEDAVFIRPCADVFDPKTVRASMGALFSLRVRVYDSFDQYLAEHPARAMFPFMLDGSRSLPDVLQTPPPARWTLIFGNEGTGLPASFRRCGTPVRIPSNDRVDSLNLSIAAGIAIYAFTQADPGCATAGGIPRG